MTRLHCVILLPLKQLMLPFPGGRTGRRESLLAMFHSWNFHLSLHSEQRALTGRKSEFVADNHPVLQQQLPLGWCWPCWRWWQSSSQLLQSQNFSCYIPHWMLWTTQNHLGLWNRSYCYLFLMLILQSLLPSMLIQNLKFLTNGLLSLHAYVHTHKSFNFPLKDCIYFANNIIFDVFMKLIIS